MLPFPLWVVALFALIGVRASWMARARGKPGIATTFAMVSLCNVADIVGRFQGSVLLFFRVEIVLGAAALIAMISGVVRGETVPARNGGVGEQESR